MKRLQIFVLGAFIATHSLLAQSVDADWHTSVDRLKTLVQSSSAQATVEAEQLLKGKNKKNIELVTAIANVYLDAGKVTEAELYLTLAKKIESKSAMVSVLEGDIALEKKQAGTACQLYEQAIYFDSQYEPAYLKFADVYKMASPQLAIEKLEQLKAIHPSSRVPDQKLAEIYYLNNRFDKAVEAYARFIDSSETTEDDLMKYAFALFLNHQFEESLAIVNKGLQRNSHHAAFNRLAMYNYTDLKRYDEALKAAEAFFLTSEKAEFSYLDYMYRGHLLSKVKRYEEAVVEYQKALKLDSTKTDLWREISDAYENENKYAEAVDAYKSYYASLPADKQSADLSLQLGKLYYRQATQSDSLTVTALRGKSALSSADSLFVMITQSAPDSYLGYLWRARVHSALDPETLQGLAKPFYEKVLALLTGKNEPRYNSVWIECYSYLGYYYLVGNKLPESKECWNKILAIDPANATAKKALTGIK